MKVSLQGCIVFYSLISSEFVDFIREFLRQLGELSDSDKTSSCCQDAYNKTLAKHHPWVVRKAAVVAMYTMPTRELLFRKVFMFLYKNNRPFWILIILFISLF